MQIEKLSVLMTELSNNFSLQLEQTTRLFHGRGQRFEGLEQLTVDWLEGQLLVAIFKPQDEVFIQQLKDSLLKWVEGKQIASVLLQYRYQENAPTEVLYGELYRNPVIHENGLKYQLDLAQNQNMGLFLDMKNGRDWVRAHSAEKNVLNLFSYTCGFSVAAMAGGAKQVLNLDMARNVLNRGRENHRLNELDTNKVKFFAHDLFKSWGKLKRFSPYDVIIIDPPSFQKGSFALSADYPKVLRRLDSLSSDDCYVLACVNSPQVTSDFLIQGMREHAPAFTFMQRIENPAEFMDIDPESGLKVLLFKKNA